MEIRQRCELLADAFERRGVRVRENLRPGLRPDEISAAISGLGLQLPESVAQLYEWRNGTRDEHTDTEGRYLVFRDNVFISIERAVAEYHEMVRYYAGTEPDADGLDLRKCFPISTFEGCWDAVSCGTSRLGAKAPHPIVRVHQGVTLFYDSLPAMLDTCRQWVSNPGWKQFDGLATEEERRIFRECNPMVGWT